MAPRTPKAIAAVPIAAQDAEAANAVVAAQAIEENASANVARRDDVCLRRNWLRRACIRKQSWIAVAAAAADRIPSPQTTPAKTASSVSTAHDRGEHKRDHADHGLYFGPKDSTRSDRRGRDKIGSVLTGDRQPGKPAGQLARRVDLRLLSVPRCVSLCGMFALGPFE